METRTQCVLEVCISLQLSYRLAAQLGILRPRGEHSSSLTPPTPATPDANALLYGPLPLMIAAPEGYSPLNLTEVCATLKLVAA